MLVRTAVAALLAALLLSVAAPALAAGAVAAGPAGPAPVGPGPAGSVLVVLAHAGGLTSAASEARVLGVEPAVPGLDVAAVEFGARLRLVNGTDEVVVVEPLPGSALSGLPVVAPGGTAYWVDPRVRAVAEAPRPDGGAAPWRVPLRVGDSAVTIVGEQRFPPPPPAGLWLLAAALALVATAAVGVLGARRRWGPSVLVVLTCTVLGAHLVHVLGSAAVPEDRSYPLMALSAAGYALLGWPIGASGAWLTLRGRPAGPLLCAVAGGLFAIVIAPVDAFSLVDAVVPFAWGADLDRALVAVTLGGGLGLAVAGAAALRARDA